MASLDDSCVLDIVQYNFEDPFQRIPDPITVNWPQDMLDKWELEARLSRPPFMTVLVSQLRRKYNASRRQRRPRSARNNH